MATWEERLADDDAAVLPIGVVAEILEVTVQSLRRFDELDVVSPQRTDGGQRRYSRNDVAKLARVRDLADEGITVNGIRRILALEEQLADALTELEALRARLADADA